MKDNHNQKKKSYRKSDRKLKTIVLEFCTVTYRSYFQCFSRIILENLLLKAKRSEKLPILLIKSHYEILIWIKVAVTFNLFFFLESEKIQMESAWKISSETKNQINISSGHRLDSQPMEC